MNRKGVFCFVLLLAFVAIEARLLAASGEAASRIEKAEELGFEAEKAWLARAVMENDVDLAIKEALGQSLLLNLEPEETKLFANAKLAGLFFAMEKAEWEGLEIEFSPKSKNLHFLNENSAVTVKAAGKKTIEAEYCFTGGILKNKKVYADIRAGKALIGFELPIGYCIGESVIG